MGEAKMEAKLEGLRELMASLDSLASNAIDFHRTERLIGEALRHNTREQYETNGAQSGGWQPLTERYARRRLVGEGSTPLIERRTGATFRALTQANAPDSILDVQKGSVTYGASTRQAALQQRGTSRMPARPLIVATPWLTDELVKIEHDDVESFGRSLGFEAIR
jgi:hypothetical protein